MKDTKTSPGCICRDYNIFADTLPIIIPLIHRLAFSCLSVFLILKIVTLFINEPVLSLLLHYTCFYPAVILILWVILWSLAILYLLLPVDFLLIQPPYLRDLQFYRVTGKVCIPDPDNENLYYFYSDFSPSKIKFLRDIDYTEDTLLKCKVFVLLKIYEDLFGEHSMKHPSVDLKRCAQFKYLFDDINSYTFQVS